MTGLHRMGFVAAGALLLAGGAGIAAAAAHRAQNAKVTLASDAQFGVRGGVTIQRRPATRKAPVRELLTIRMQKLAVAGTYSFFADNPLDESTSLMQFEPYSVTPKRNRTAIVKYDTGGELQLPFGATLDQLAGQRLQVRDGSGNVVLSGTIPEFKAR